MQKILILGSCGAGKSTFAKKLSKILKIKLIHLDQHYWKSNQKRTEKNEWEEKIISLTKENQWIMDGNYRNTLDIRIPRADTIIWLDFPAFICFYHVLKRKFKNNRVDKIKFCEEKVDFDLIKWILWTFPRTTRKEIENKLKKVSNQKNIYILKSNKDMKSFLSKIK